MLVLKWNDSDDWPFIAKIRYVDYDAVVSIIDSALKVSQEAEKANEDIDRKLPVVMMFEALCPNHSLEKQRQTAEQVVNACEWKKYLGKQRILRANDEAAFRQKLHSCIVPKIENDNGQWRRTVSTWPIIGKVSIALKAKILE